MRVEGYGTSTGGWGADHGHVLLPKGPVVHRGRPEPKPSGFIMHNTEEFSRELVMAPVKRRRRPTRRSGKPAEQRSPLGLPAAVIEQIVDLYVKDGLTMKEIRGITGVSHATISKYLHLEGVEIAARYMPQKRDVPKTCINCGAEFRRRPDERGDLWARRTCCNRRCAGTIAAAKRLGKAA